MSGDWQKQIRKPNQIIAEIDRPLKLEQEWVPVGVAQTLELELKKLEDKLDDSITDYVRAEQATEQLQKDKDTMQKVIDEYRVRCDALGSRVLELWAKVEDANKRNLLEKAFMEKLKAEYDKVFADYCNKRYTDAYYNGYLDAYEYAKELWAVLASTGKEKTTP